jgi:hypothetical protein
MSVNQRNPTAYGFSQPLVDVSGKTIISKRAPTARDKAQIATLWINTTDQSVYIITSIIDNVANWELLSTAGGTVTDLVADDLGLAAPIGGIVGVLGGSNINTTSDPNAIRVNLNDSVSITGNMEVGGNYSLPNTDGTGTVGVIIFGADRFISNRGTENTFVGSDSGTPTLTVASAVHNSAYGFESLSSLTTGESNCAFGANSMVSCTTGSFNVGLGESTLFNVTTGNNNVAVGDSCGSNIDTGSSNIIFGFNAASLYTSESNNICIQNSGSFADANTLRIGTQGSGAQQINTAYIAGITGSALTANSALTLCGPDGKLGTLTGTSGQILIGQTSATPQWGALTSTGGSVTITHPTAGTINLEAAGVAALTGLAADTGTAAPTAGIINIIGDGSVTSTIAGGSNLVISLINGTNGQLLIGGGADPIWANLTSTGGSVTITNTANGINLEAAGVAALTELTASSGGAATPVAGNINLLGSGIITTVRATNNITVRATTANNGQIPIGNTGTGIPTWATITAGSGITVTNGANAITIAATGTEATRPAFSYVQAIDTTIAQPYNTVVYLGQQSVLIPGFDQDNNVSPGDGAGTAAFFTAPVTGIYSLTFQIDARSIVVGSLPIDRIRMAQYIITPLQTFVQRMAIVVYGSAANGANDGVVSYTVTAKMNAGQIALFGIALEVNSSSTPTYVIGQNNTLISGYLISQTA